MMNKTPNSYSIRENIKFDLFTGLYSKDYFEQTVNDLLYNNKHSRYALITICFNTVPENRKILEISNRLLKLSYPATFSVNRFIVLIHLDTPFTNPDDIIKMIFNSNILHKNDFSFVKSIFPEQGKSYSEVLKNLKSKYHLKSA